MTGRPASRLASATLARLVGAAAADPASTPSELRVVALNLLAPIWSSPAWYPQDMDAALLESGYRRERLEAFLRGVAASADVVCLQEVQDSELPYFMAALGADFQGATAVNDPALWTAPATRSEPVLTCCAQQRDVAPDCCGSPAGNRAARIHSRTPLGLPAFRIFRLVAVMEVASSRSIGSGAIRSHAAGL